MDTYGKKITRFRGCLCGEFYTKDTTILIRRDSVLNVEPGDILTVICGLFIVIIIALIANPHYLSGPGGTPVLTQTTAITTTSVTPLATPQTTTAVTSTPSLPPAPSPPYRIYYTDKPFSYPVFRLPDRPDLYGESDILHSDNDVITFAYIEGKGGGLTQVFTVPYPVWLINITVSANTTPQYADFRMVLCYAKNGTIIDGFEVVNQGKAVKKIQTSNIPLYLIISTRGIDGYWIDLQTTRSYYEQVKPQQSETQGL
jgi:hypothetical protein